LLKALAHLFGPVQKLLSSNLAVGHIQTASHHVKEELLALIRDLRANPHIFAAGHLVPTFRRIHVHHAAKPTAATSALEATASAEAAAPAATLEAAGSAATARRTTAARLLAKLSQSRGWTEE
jgi:hypothetical protein